MVTTKPVRDYLAAFDLRAVFVAPDGDVRVGLDPGVAYAAWWTGRRDAHRVARRARSTVPIDILAAAAQLDIPLTEHAMAMHAGQGGRCPDQRGAGRGARPRRSAIFQQRIPPSARCGSSGRRALHELCRGDASAAARARLCGGGADLGGDGGAGVRRGASPGREGRGVRSPHH